MAKMMSAMEMVNMMESFKGQTFVRVQTRTAPKFIGYKRDKSVLPRFMAETGSDHPENIRKYAEYNAQIGLDYTHVIESRLLRQDKDTSEYSKGESWHIPYGESRLIRQHKTNGELYFYLFLTAKTSPIVRYVDTVKGLEIDSAKVKPFLTPDYAPTNQGLEEGTEVLVRTLKLESLLSMKLNGEEYIVR